LRPVQALPALTPIGDSFQTSPDPFIALLIAGFAVGVFGYLAGSRFFVAIGVALVFLATLIIPLVLSVYR
jgi:hypothetical protein